MPTSERRNTNSQAKNPYRKPGIILTIIGCILIILSFFLELAILTVSSLGIIFWGIFFTFARSPKVVPTEVFNSSFSSMPNVLDGIIHSLNFERGMYVPPGYFENTGGGGVLLLRKGKNEKEPREIASYKELSIPSNGYYGPPPGIGLVNFLEEKLGTSLSGKDIEFLENALVKVFTEYGIVEDVQIETRKNIVHFEMINPIYAMGCEEIRKHQSYVCIYIGCPFCSALAYMLAKVTNKIVIIERNELSSDNKRISVWCRIVEPRS